MFRLGEQLKGYPSKSSRNISRSFSTNKLNENFENFDNLDNQRNLNPSVIMDSTDILNSSTYEPRVLGPCAYPKTGCGPEPSTYPSPGCGPSPGFGCIIL